MDQWRIYGYRAEFLDLIKDDNTMLERGPLNKASEMGELMAFCHEGFYNVWIIKGPRSSQ